MPDDTRTQRFVLLARQSEEYSKISDSTLEDLARYVKDGDRPSGFLSAILENDLFHAVSRADLENKQSIVPLVKLIYNHLPAGSYGSPKQVESWCREKQGLPPIEDRKTDNISAEDLQTVRELLDSWSENADPSSKNDIEVLYELRAILLRETEEEPENSPEIR